MEGQEAGARRESEISAQIANCMKMLEVANQAARGLTERLSPALRPAGARNETSNDPRRDKVIHTTKLGTSLGTISVGISNLADDLRALESRVEL